MSKHTPQIVGNYIIHPDSTIVSNHLWRGQGPRIVAHNINEDGYKFVRLTVGGKRKKWLLHSLMAELFLGKKPGLGFQVCHRDGNKLYCHVDNLYWGTAKQNAQDRDRHGKTSRGRYHSQKIKAAIEKSKINARLIAAAPELLEAAKELIEEIDSQASLGGPTFDDVLLRAAIAKAEGEK